MVAARCAQLFRRLGGDERGQDLIEYAMLIGLIAILAVAAVSELGRVVVDVFWAAIQAAMP